MAQIHVLYKQVETADNAAWFIYSGLSVFSLFYLIMCDRLCVLFSDTRIRWICRGSLFTLHPRSFSRKGIGSNLSLGVCFLNSGVT